MLTAALRHSAFGSLALIGAWLGSVQAADTPSRSQPTRPGSPTIPSVSPAPARSTPPPLPTRRIGRVEYVEISAVASHLGLKLGWVERGRKARLTHTTATAEITAGRREMRFNGLRIFLGDPATDAGGRLYLSRIDVERCLTPLVRPGLGVVTPARPKIVVLDPGHGGKDTGTSEHEKTYTLDVALRARKLLQAAGYRVVLTRETDKFVELIQRPAIANANRADLFVSIHFNALPRDTKTSGVEIFTFAPQHQRSTDAWSPGKRDDTFTHAEPANRFDHWNVALAWAVHHRFVADLKTFDRGKKIAHWGVLRSLNCPGVLVECGFLTSESEAKKIATSAYRQKLAETIAAGIRDYAAVVDRARMTVKR